MAKKVQSKSFLLRLDADTMEKVEAWAAQEFRSVNGQIQWIIAESLRRHGRIKNSSSLSEDELKSGN
ncbi:MAG: Arc family DNA-binding protein [Muribaculaceae bacterium]|nr:Arc family DNA-binding protein [Muribaculaceae bacterium]